MINVPYIYSSATYKPGLNQTKNPAAAQVNTPAQTQYAAPAAIYPQETRSIYNPQKSKPAQASIFCINDVHGQNIRMEKLYSAMQQFNSTSSSAAFPKFFTSDDGVSKMRFASGDIFLGEDIKNIKTADEFLNISGYEANVLGNHEADKPTDEFVEATKDRKYKLMGANLHPSENNPMSKILTKSYIKEINGDRYGIIGLVPPDLAHHVKIQDHLPDLHIDDIDETIKDLKTEVEKLKAQGINKFILLSHVGLRNDKKIIENVPEIDIILSAHTHNLLEGVKEGVNLFYNKNNDPVVITQSGRDGEHFGILNVKFDENGVLTSVQNNIMSTDQFHRNLYARECFEKILGKPEKVGFVKSVDPTPNDIYANENPNCSFITDALRSELNTDIAVMNSANIRGKFEPGTVDTRDLLLLSPFANHIAVVETTEDKIVNAVRSRIQASMASNSHRPGVLQISGLRYKYNKKGELLSLSFVDKQGKETPIDINNPSKTKKYTIAGDDFCLENEEMGIGLTEEYKNALKKYNEDKDKFVADYIRHQNKPVEIKLDGRIQVSDT